MGAAGDEDTAVRLRPEAPEDRQAIHDLNVAAFGQSGEARLVDLLRGSGDAVFSLVAEGGGTVVGHALLSRMAGPVRALALAPVAVHPAHQRAGIGSALVRQGLARARADGWAAVLVLGDPAFYGRFGFSAGAARNLRNRYSGPYLLGLELEQGALSAPVELLHAPAFASIEGE